MLIRRRSGGDGAARRDVRFLVRHMWPAAARVEAAAPPPSAPPSGSGTCTLPPLTASPPPPAAAPQDQLVRSPRPVSPDSYFVKVPHLMGFAFEFDSGVVTLVLLLLGIFHLYIKTRIVCKLGKLERAGSNI